MTDQTATASDDQALKGEAVATVPMWREFPLSHGGPTKADVHPNEVDNMVAHGWRVAGPASGHAFDEGEGAEKAPAPALEDMTIAQLRAAAKARGIAYSPQFTREQLIAAIRGE